MNENTTKRITEIRATIADTPQTSGTLSAAKTSWIHGDRVSVFNGTTGNERWRLVGETGERMGVLSRMNGEPSRTAIDGVVAIYPYEFHNTLSANGNACINIPAQQTYCATRPAGTMVAYGSEEGLSFRNVGCCIEIGLMGDARICRLEIRGNAGETLAGVAEIDRELKVAFIDKESNKITLDCGDGKDLGSAPTRFCFAMLPQTFEHGLTITIFDSEKRLMTYRVNDPITLCKSEVFSVAETEYIGKMPTNCIWYESVNDIVITPNYRSLDKRFGLMCKHLGESHGHYAFNANIVSNTNENGKGVICFDNYLDKIGDNAFYDCKSLTNLAIPDCVILIGDWAFYGCSRLTSITIPNSVTEIGDNAFKDCMALKKVHITSLSAWCRIKFHIGASNPLYNAHNLYLNDNLVTNLVIPESVTMIGDHAFYGCRSLTSVTIPSTVKEIGGSTFCDCTSLTHITMSNSVTAVGAYAFRGCRDLTSVIIPNSVTEIGSGIFSGCSGLTGFYGKFASEDKRCLVVDGVLNSFAPNGLTEYIIPDDITKIGMYAFSGCTGLLNVSIPDSVTEIGVLAFYDCRKLTSVTIPDSITVIGLGAFQECIGLKSVTIPDSITKIADSTFKGCVGMTSCLIPDSVIKINGSAFNGCVGLIHIIIPDNCISICSYAFSGCISLTSIYCKPTTPPTLGKDVFDNIAPNAKIYVPRASVNAYKTAKGWEDYASRIEGYDF